MMFSSNFLKRWSFRKRPRWDMIFLVLSGKMVFFFPKNMIFFPWEKARDYFSQEIHRNMIFSAYIYGCYRRCVTPLCHKNQRWSYAAKIHLKVIHVLDWHLKKSSSNSLYLHKDLYRCFHVLLSSEKNPGKLIYSTEVWLLLQFIQLKIFYNE